MSVGMTTSVMSMRLMSIPSGWLNVSSNFSIRREMTSLFESSSSSAYSPMTTRSTDMVACLMTFEGSLTASTEVIGSMTFQ